MSEVTKIATRVSYGNALVELAKEHDDVYVLDADLAAATQTAIFKKEFPERHIDCGIAECNMIGIADGDTLIYATHGHTYNEQNLPPLHRGDILLHGHTHVPACVPHDTYTCMNPGSVAIPKAGSWHGYLIMENGRFQWKTMTNEVKMEFADGKRIL